MDMRLVAIAAAVFIAGCNTMHGAGEDLKAGKNKVESFFSKKDRNDQPNTTGGALETTPSPYRTTVAPGANGASTETPTDTGAGSTQ